MVTPPVESLIPPFVLAYKGVQLEMELGVWGERAAVSSALLGIRLVGDALEGGLVYLNYEGCFA